MATYKTRVEEIKMKGKYWFNQAVEVLTNSLNDLTYAFTEGTLSEDEMKAINFKIRELSDMIPDWDRTFRRRDKLNELKES